MLAILFNFLVGRFCSHQWELFDTIDVYVDELKNPDDSKYPISYKYILKCTKCGDLKCYEY